MRPVSGAARQLAALDALHVKAVDRDLSGCGAQLAGDQFDDRRLAGAGRPDQKYELALVDRKTDPIEGRSSVFP